MRDRLDRDLVARGIATTPERAQALIAAGLVEVDGLRAVRADQAIGADTSIRLLREERPFASRAGAKLAGALVAFGIDPAGRVALDAGASSGGFTDVLLRRGARRVYAVDVGYGQLDHRLATDDRVTVMDRTNLRSLLRVPGEAPTLVTLDLSFISLRAVLGPVANISAPGGDIVALFKPQFELPQQAVGKGGVVLDDADAERAAARFLIWVGETHGAECFGPLKATVRGTKGNQEYLVHCRLPMGASG